MATIATTEFRPTDIYQYIPFTPLQAGVTLAASAAGHIKVACFQEPVRVLEMVLVTAAGAGAFAATNSARVAFGTQATAVTAQLGTNLGSAVTGADTLLASSNVNLPVDTATTYGSVDTGLPPVVPAGSVIGINIAVPASGNLAAVVGVYLRYRPA